MKRLLVYAVVILSCSCREAAYDHHSGQSDAIMKRRDEAREVILAAYRKEYPSSGLEVRLRGPLTVSQVEKELIKLMKSHETKVAQAIPHWFENTDIGRSWARIKSRYKKDDGLYHYVVTVQPSCS